MAQERILIRGFGERVEEVINESGLTKKELAKRCRCDKKTFMGLDEKTLQTGILVRLCAEIGVSSDYILGLSTKKNIQK